MGPESSPAFLPTQNFILDQYCHNIAIYVVRLKIFHRNLLFPLYVVTIIRKQSRLLLLHASLLCGLLFDPEVGGDVSS
jgi:hypothetical protein